LADDDIELKSNFNEIIIKSFVENPEYDILAFDLERIGSTSRKNSSKEKEINVLTSMRLSSAQLTFKLDFLRENGITFDERFGAGSKYSMGEENILLLDALKKGANIKYIPKVIATLYMGNSTWFEGFNEKYLFDKGAIFWRMFGYFAPIYSLTYCIRKRKL